MRFYPNSMGEREGHFLAETLMSGAPVRAVSGPPTRHGGIGSDIPTVTRQRVTLGRVNQIAGKKRPKNYMVQLPTQGIYA